MGPELDVTRINLDETPKLALGAMKASDVTAMFKKRTTAAARRVNRKAVIVDACCVTVKERISELYESA